MIKAVDPKLIEKWLPLIEGQGDWKDFVGACPKVKAKDYGIMATVFENIELTEGTVSGDSAPTDYKPILIPMTRRIMPALVGPQMFGTQPLAGPTGLVFALRAVFGGDSVNPLKRSTSVILVLADASGIAVGDDCSTATPGVGKIRHIDGNVVLVEVISGSFAIGNIDDAAE